MQDTAELLHYPISLDQIIAKVNRKNGSNRQLTIDFPQQILKKKLSYDIKEIVNDFGEKIVRVEGEIPVDLPIKNGTRFLFISHDQSILSHGLHKYPAKFFPEPPRWLIKRYSNDNGLILDPFSGSAKLNNISVPYGTAFLVEIDVDPFARHLEA